MTLIPPEINLGATLPECTDWVKSKRSPPKPEVPADQEEILLTEESPQAAVTVPGKWLLASRNEIIADVLCAIAAVLAIGVALAYGIGGAP